MILGSTRYIHPPIYDPPCRPRSSRRDLSACLVGLLTVVFEEDGIKAVTGDDVMAVYVRLTVKNCFCSIWELIWEIAYNR